MKKHIIVMIVFVIIMIVIGFKTNKIQERNMIELNKFEVRIDNLVENTVDTTTRAIISDPDILFRLLDYSPQWEEVKAIPYSRCYRHLIGTSTISNYIMCKAI